MNDNNKIFPIDFKEFSKKIKVNHGKSLNFKKVFEKDILDIPKYAIGSYFWFIPDNSNVTIVDCSDNIHELTSYKKDEWKNYSPEFLSPIMHPEDWLYFLGGVQFMLKYLENIDIAARKHYRFNIYARIKNENDKYIWMVIQFPKIIYNQEGKGLSSLIVVSDLSHFDIVNQPQMSLIDTTSVKKTFHRAFIENDNGKVNYANITERK